MTAAQDSRSPYASADWAGGYRTLEAEQAYVIDAIEGTIPAELTGTLFRNGPGRFERGGVSYKHPFDGDGMISAVRFAGGRAHFQNRFVRTEGFIQESAAGRILSKNVFGTLRPGGFWANAFDFGFKNVANTGVVYHGGRLLALWEAAPPHRLDPASLETFGLDDLAGALCGGKPFAAHPRLDPATGDLISFGVRTGLQTVLYIYRLSPDGGVRVESEHTVPGFAFVHDFALTENYWVFFQNPMALDPLPFVLGFKAAGECLRLAPGEPTRILLIPRNGGPVQTIATEPFFVFHHVNAFEREGRIVVDSIRYEEYITTQEDRDFRQTDFSRLPEGWIWRTQIDPVKGRVEARPLLRRSAEFPQVHPDRVGRPYRFAFAAAVHAEGGNAPLQAIAKLDVETGRAEFHSFAPSGFVSEPIFVPRPDGTAEDDGWLLAMVYDARRDRSDLWILDGRDLTCLTRLGLKHHVPYSLHGTFVPEVFVHF
ncbi:carotenoid oxygenase family protein [Gloeobacter violaceus]|uniref:Gll3689 protein n=1 Tax=Gloeobacter violaceus (strain ATCC 29082 / PCC 7421) TaxID=251221 RepID=Q7NF37_GLOVI|nr:carotenoid oxygenase family protein [Gloeobacter violaceus]BAC91630.1 gll3689 [Gloeobacter violaceus PCC 7421]